jgi:hypothetical protein
MEVERFRLGAKGSSFLPLKYALDAIERINRGKSPEREQSRAALQAMLRFIEQAFPNREHVNSETGREISRVLSMLEGSVSDTARQKPPVSRSGRRTQASGVVRTRGKHRRAG